MLTLEGTQLGNYDVIRRIRVGGMGAVYEGRQRTAFGRRVAIKVILGSYASDREMRRRFAREARTVAQLHHPHHTSPTQIRSRSSKDSRTVFSCASQPQR